MKGFVGFPLFLGLGVAGELEDRVGGAGADELRATRGEGVGGCDDHLVERAVGFLALIELPRVPERRSVLAEDGVLRDDAQHRAIPTQRHDLLQDRSLGDEGAEAVAQGELHVECDAAPDEQWHQGESEQSGADHQPPGLRALAGVVEDVVKPEGRDGQHHQDHSPGRVRPVDGSGGEAEEASGGECCHEGRERARHLRAQAPEAEGPHRDEGREGAKQREEIAGAGEAPLRLVE